MANDNRALAKLIPTGNLGVSVATGALVTFGIFLLATRFPNSSFGPAIMLTPFISGFVAGIAYGGVGTEGVKHLLPTGLLSFLSFYSLVFLSAIVFRPWFFPKEIGWSVYFFMLFPPYLLAPMVMSIAGATFGWLAALAMRR